MSDKGKCVEKDSREGCHPQAPAVSLGDFLVHQALGLVSSVSGKLDFP